MIKAAVIYDDNGKIVRLRTGGESGIKETAENSAHNYIYFEEIPDVDNKYVENEQLVAMPEQPSQWHEFDYGTKSWALNLELGKQSKWIEIKTARHAQEFGTFEWGEYIFDCNEVSQRRIQGAVQLAAIDSTMTLDWTLTDNTVKTFTAQQYIQIGQSLAIHVSEAHERGRILRQQIESATTEAELEAIVW